MCPNWVSIQGSARQEYFWRTLLVAQDTLRKRNRKPCCTIDRFSRSLWPAEPALEREQVERGLGDDQSPRGMWGDLDPWLASLWSNLLQLKPLPSGIVIDDTPRLEPALFSMTPVPVPASGGNTCTTAGVRAVDTEHLHLGRFGCFFVLCVFGFVVPSGRTPFKGK